MTNVMTFRERCEKKRCRIQKIEHMVKTLLFIVVLIIWSVFLMGMTDFAAGGW